MAVLIICGSVLSADLVITGTDNIIRTLPYGDVIVKFLSVFRTSVIVRNKIKFSIVLASLVMIVR